MFTNKIILLLSSLGLFQGVFLSFYLLSHKSRNRKPNIFLAFVLLGLTVRIGKSVLNYYMPLDDWQRNIGISGIFIVGPFLWIYGMLIIEKKQSIPLKVYFHLLPFVLFIVFFTVIPSGGKFATYWNYGLVVFHLAIYLILSWLLLLKHRSGLLENAHRWYRNILLGITIVWCFYLGNFLDFNIYYITGPIFYTFLIYAFSYLLLNRHHFSLDKYSSSGLDRDTSKELFQKVNRLFIEEDIYLESDISIKTIADRLSVNARSVSQVINENKKQNFYEFVNQFRIEKAKSFLTDSKYRNEKLATIAFDSGFNNVTSFNVAFKKNTGITPSTYRKQYFSTW